MSLVNEVRAAVSGLASAQAVRVDDGSLHFHCELTELDKLACAFNEFVLENDSLASATLAQLSQVAENLSKRLTYLLEPITPIEIDSEQCVVQMRSNPPQKGDTGTTYYELLVRRGGKLSLCRYSKPPGGDRQVIPAHVTLEVFFRLVDDFAAAA